MYTNQVRSALNESVMDRFPDHFVKQTQLPFYLRGV